MAASRMFTGFIFRIMEKQKQVEVLHIRHGARQEFKTGDLK